MKYKIGEKVKTSITDDEGVVIATDDNQDEFSKVKVKFNKWFIPTEWIFESMLNKIITKDKPNE